MRIRQLILSVVLATATAPAFASDYHVDLTGADGAFTTIQAAIDTVSDQTELNRANIFIAPGTYVETLIVEQPFISLIGTGASPDAVRIVFARTASVVEDFDWGQVVWIRPSATAFMARNLTVQNSSPDNTAMPALALQSSAERAIFDNVRVIGFRDTLLVDFAARQYFRNSSITGDADFIFGDATAVFDHCTIVSTDAGYIAAPSTLRTSAIGMVFLDCLLLSGSDRSQTGGDNSTAENNSVFLARPWMWWDADHMPSATFIRTRMGPQITTEGWDPWNGTGVAGVDPHSDRDPVTRFAEFGSMNLAGEPLRDSNGDGKPDGRASWADPMSADQAANYTLEHIFGPADFWNTTTQPDAPDMPYVSDGAAWNPAGQLALLPSTAGAASRPLNLSTRLRTETGENVAIAGFILRGTAAKPIVVRALGPSLSEAGIADALANPTLALREANGTLVRFNGNWMHSQATEITATGLAPESDVESAVVASLTPGAYTATVKGYKGTSGVALAEIYDLDPNDDTTQLANISTRGVVGAGDDVMIGGFILGGGEGTAKVLIRGIGPSLAQSGIAEPLLDPILTLHDSEGALITSNDDWQESQPSEIEATGIPPSDARESAIVATLPAGSYTAVLSGNDGSGVGLIEVYSLQ
jgi:hypothetical protein